MSKYRNSRPDSKNFKFFSSPVFQIIDSKHGSPEDYSDFLKILLYIAIFEDIAIHSNIFLGSTSVSHDFGSRKIFLLLNDSSHDPHFSACQNIETLDRIQKISNFFLHGFSRYLTPNMALQKIILTSFQAEQLRCSASYFYFGSRTTWVTKDFFTPKRFEPRHSFFSMSKYRNSGTESKNFKFFSLQVFQIFDSKHGSPENYSDFFLFFLLPDRGLCVLRDITPRRS